MNDPVPARQQHENTQNMSQAIFSRRDALGTAACGFGQLALTGLLNTSASAAPANPLRPRQPHLPPRAKRIIFLFMQGGPSHVDSFDYKPVLEKRDGEPLPFADARAIATYALMMAVTAPNR